MSPVYVCTLHVEGRSTVVVAAADEHEAARKAEEYDPWELQVDVVGVQCDDVEVEEEDITQ
jgi:hypothetical protein